MGQAGSILVKQCAQYSTKLPVFVGMENVHWQSTVITLESYLYSKASFEGVPRERFGKVSVTTRKDSMTGNILCSGILWFSFLL
eukprot:jgi/Galph1/6040/GphlegSOOS_G4761.1